MLGNAFFESMILQRAFYEREVVAVSKDLLGKILVHESPEGLTAGKIVEVEAYLGPEDKAAHSSGGRRTARNEVMYGQKGHAYVYFIYGLYYCINVTAGAIPGKPEAVLIRAVEPVDGVDIMAKRRGVVDGKVANLTNGPSRLCMAMDISRAQNNADLTHPPLYINDAPAADCENIVESTRIGIDYAAAEWRDKPWRFFIRNSKYVSRK